MTQPQPVAEAPSTGTVLAGAALALALIALEGQARQQIQDDIQAAFATIAAVAVITASTAPGTVFTGLALLSTPRFHAALAANLDRLRRQVSTTVRAAYDAATQVAYTKISAELADLGHTSTDLPELGTTVDTILRDIDTMIGHAQTDVQNSVRAAYDGITGDNPGPARLLAVRQAVLAAQARLAQRAHAAATTAIHRGSTDTAQALYHDFHNSTGTAGLMKRWRTTSATPCGMCQALDGTTVGVTAEFDHQATTNTADLRRVWRDLSGPPRHPNCRCQLELVTT